MTDSHTSRQQLLVENAALRARLNDAEETLHAIQGGEADALVLFSPQSPQGDHIHTMKNALEPYRVMVEAMGEGAVTLSPDGTLLFCNSHFAEWVKLPREQITGMSLRGMIAKQERQRFDAMLPRGAQEVVREALTLQAADGTQTPALFSMSPLPQSEGRVISVVIADLSEVAAATAARSRLALIVDSSDDAIVSTTLEGVVQSWNRAAEQLFGFSADEAIGRPLQTLTIPPEQTAVVSSRFDATRRGERTGRVESMWRRKDGSLIEVSVIYSPILDPAGVVVGASINTRDITERKQIEAELRESEEAFGTMSENLPGMVYRVHIREAGRMQFFNAMPVQITGYAADELTTGKVCSIEPLILDEDRPGVEAEVRRAMVAKRAFTVEYRLQHKDGGIRWMVEHGMPVYGTDDAPLYIDGVIFDITEQKQAEEHLKLFRTLLDHSNDGIEVLEPSTLRFLDINEAECRALGYSREELLGMSVLDIDLTFTPELAKATEEILRLEGNTHFETEHQRKDGSTFPVEVHTTMVELDKTYILSIVRDITEHKQAQELLRQSEEKFRSITGSAQDAIMMMDDEGKVTYWNRAAEEMFGYPAQEAIGRMLHRFIVPPRFLEAHNAVFDHFVETGEGAIVGKTRELTALKKDGTEFPIELSLSAVMISNHWNAIGILRDITERKEAEEEIKFKNTMLQTQQEVSPDAILVVDENAQIISYNQQFIDMWHVPPQILDAGLDEPVLKAVIGNVENPETFVARVQYLYEHRDEKSHEEIVLKDGRIIDRYSAATTGADGVYYGRVWYFRDITERKQAELKLHESERRFTDLLENVELISMMLDRESRITYCNDYLLRLSGWQRKEVIGKNWWELFVPPEMQDLGGVFFTSLLDNQPAARHHENDIVTRSGERRLVRWNNSVLRSGTGEVIGAASIGEDITEQKRSEESIKYLNRVLSVLSGINTLIVRVNDREELLREACNIAVDEGGFRMAMLVVVDRVTMLPVSVTSAGKDEELLVSIKDVMSTSDGMQTTLVARVIKEKEAIISNDTQNDLRLLFGKQYAEAGVKSMTVMPLVISGEAFGVLALYASEIEFFQQDEMNLLTELTGDIAYAIDHIDKQERLNYLAYYDVLTGLANRSLFLDRISQYIRSATSSGHKLAIGLIDLERFKNINDGLGRVAGDSLLKQVAEWLIQFMHDANQLARIDADHFAFVLPEIETDGSLARLTEGLMSAFQGHSFELNDAMFRIGIKVGLAVFPDDGDNVDSLYTNAEAALKKAKLSGDRYLFYTQKMTEKVADKLSLENQLRRAIDNEEFVLYYQPKVNIMSGKVTSAEALIRWNDPITGLVPPVKFIPMLEDTGMILEVGRWALHQAIEDNKRWRAAGLATVRIAVNVSPLQLRNINFIDEIRQIIALDSYMASELELEITESLIMDNVEQNIAKLQAIRAMGITIAIDDFGTGFSSLSYLAKLPVDTLKVDRAFVIEMDKPEGLALVTTIIVMAHALNLKVIAEGVETEQQMRQLLSLNCDEIQGFLFSKPVPAEIFEAKFLVPIAPDEDQ